MSMSYFILIYQLLRTGRFLVSLSAVGQPTILLIAKLCSVNNSCHYLTGQNSLSHLHDQRLSSLVPCLSLLTKLPWTLAECWQMLSLMLCSNMKLERASENHLFQPSVFRIIKMHLLFSASMHPPITVIFSNGGYFHKKKDARHLPGLFKSSIMGLQC